MVHQRGRVCWCILTPCCLFTSLVCLIFAAVLLHYYPSLVTQEAESKMTIVPGHSTYEQLQDPTLPVYKDIYFYNLTNPEEFHNGATPNVTEIGPYSYREYRKKYFNESNLLNDSRLLEYTQLKTFHFSPETSASGTSEDDIICTINIPYVGAVAQVLSIPNLAERIIAIGVLKVIFSLYPKSSKLYTCVPATPLIFNYTDGLIKELHTNPILKSRGMNLPTDYVSIQHNGTTNESMISIIYTGIDDIAKVGEFIKWNDLSDLGVWPGPTANDINGTEGLVFRPNLEEGDNLTAFVDDTLRSFPLVYSGKETILGLEAFRYMLPPSVFESAHVNPDNARWGSWCPNGLIYLGVLQQPNVPVFGSKPRFLDCDPEETTDRVDGVPEATNDLDTYIYVHPLIGVNVQFQRTLQLNVQLNYTSHFSPLSKIKGTMYYPMMYINEYANLTSEFEDYLMKSGLQLAEAVPIFSKTGFAVLLLISLIALLISIYGSIKLCGYYCKTCRKKENEYEVIK